MAVNSGEEAELSPSQKESKKKLIIGENFKCQSVHSAVVFPDGGPANKQNEVPSNMSSLEVPKLTKSQLCPSSDSLRFHTKVKVDKMNTYTPFILGADIEKGRAELPKIDEECVANQKSDDSFARALLQEICLQIGGKIMQLLMKHGTELPKFISRDKFDSLTPTNRSRKYKRSASFNSRRVVLLFSVLSSMGTIILIYLTLRVRQISDAYGNV